ncbi:UNVERIFIED_CONTAM: hypothetical protein RMT77_002719 [Armadillidium vulgare]|nr:hypothetical protein Avbf_18936 [Armadillidium vulgare]
MTTKYSIVWKFFTDETNMFAKCSICEKIYSRKGRGTTCLKNHLKAMHKEQFTEVMIEEAQQKKVKAEREKDKSNEWIDEIVKVEQVPTSQTPQTSFQTNRKRIAVERENPFEDPVVVPEEIPCKTIKSRNIDNEYDAFGAFVAESLKNLPLENAITAQTSIVGVLTDEKRKAVASLLHPS